jgi:hypothetical protein
MERSFRGEVRDRMSPGRTTSGCGKLPDADDPGTPGRRSGEEMSRRRRQLHGANFDTWSLDV